MRKFRWAALVVVLVALAVAVPLIAGSLSSGNDSSSAQKAEKKPLVHGMLRERAMESEEQETMEEEGGAEGEVTELYSDRAYPAAEISIDRIQGAIKANNKIKAKGAKLGSKWDSIG